MKNRDMKILLAWFNRIMTGGGTHTSFEIDRAIRKAEAHFGKKLIKRGAVYYGGDEE